MTENSILNVAIALSVLTLLKIVSFNGILIKETLFASFPNVLIAFFSREHCLERINLLAKTSAFLDNLCLHTCNSLYNCKTSSLFEYLKHLRIT